VTTPQRFGWVPADIPPPPLTRPGEGPLALFVSQAFGDRDLPIHVFSIGEL
jgi:hypothetical protein